MTDLEINEAISLHLGWHRKERPKGVWYYYFGSSFPNGATPAYALPQYATDRNDIAEALATLKAGMEFEFGIELKKRVHPETAMSRGSEWTYALKSTPRQQAEVFLRTVGKWKE